MTGFIDKGMKTDTWRQQGDAMVLASGGVCHVAVPYAAQVGSQLKSGHVVLSLQPGAKQTYRMVDDVEFSQPMH